MLVAGNGLGPELGHDKGRNPSFPATKEQLVLPGSRAVAENQLGPTSKLSLVAGPIRFGSGDSRDCDVLYQVSALPDPRTSKAFCSGSAVENRNLMVIRDGCVVETYKGLPDETNNALLATYSLHDQTERLPVTQAAVRNAPLKVVRSVRVVLSHLTKSPHREEVKTALSSNNTFQRIQCLAGIDFGSLDLSTDTKKTLAFQMAQTVALINGKELYTKQAVNEAFPKCADLINRSGGSNQLLNELRDELVSQLAGVYVRQKGNLNLFMYGNALAIDDWNQFARQSRGMIIDVQRERCVSFPMDKFFRFGEGPELSREAIPLDTPVEVVEKSDGSMVSLIWHDQKIGFSCKGNFDTEQSQRAAQIARSLPVDKLQLDRYYHVFEVIYPENRFPKGLAVVDYGDREDLVLTAMRDRDTNRLLSYAEVVAEAKRVGLSHPIYYQLTLSEAFREVDTAPLKLGTEGFIIRTVDDSRYFKLKYEAYKDVLEAVNDLRSDRFVWKYTRKRPEERQQIMDLLPSDMREIANQHLYQLNAIADNLLDYGRAIVRVGPVDGPEFAAFVAQHVPEPFRKLVFQLKKGTNARHTAELVGSGIYYKDLSFPEFSNSLENRETLGAPPIAINDANMVDIGSNIASLEESQQMQGSKMDHGRPTGTDLKAQVQQLLEIHSWDSNPNMYLEIAKYLDDTFGTGPFPKEVFDEALASLDPDRRVYFLLKIFSAKPEVFRDIIGALVKSNETDIRYAALIGLLRIDEAAAIQGLRTFNQEVQVGSVVLPNRRDGSPVLAPGQIRDDLEEYDPERFHDLVNQLD